MKRAHNIKLLSEVVIYLLYIEAISAGNNHRQQVIGEMLPDGSANNRLVGYAMDDIQNRGFLATSRDRSHNEIYALNRDGYEYARTQLTTQGSAIFECSSDLDWILGDEALGDNAPVAEDDVTQASGNDDDNWVPLPVEKEAKVYKDALEASEVAEKTIREDNGFAANHKEIRDHVVWSIGSAINQMREGLITTSQVKSMLIAPFQKVASLFTEGLLKEACERAIEKLSALV